MHKILRKRILRDLRSGITRYLALLALIIMGMYMIVGLVSSAENIIRSVRRGEADNLVEDGGFSVFIPLEDSAVTELKDKGITLEQMFYLDYQMSDDSVLRIYQNREHINRIDLTEGALAKEAGEIVLEKLYAQAKELQVGDRIKVAGEAFTVTGIGTTPDYDLVLEKDTDSSADGKNFGTAFVSREQYQQMKESGNAEKSEEYVYSYRLNDSITHDELKDYLADLDFDEEEVEDAYFQEMLGDVLSIKKDMLDGISALKDGAQTMRDGLNELTGYNQDLNEGITAIMDAYLESAGEELKSLGNNTALRESNYEQVIQGIMAENGLLKEQLQSTLSGLNGVAEYKNAITAYTQGVDSALEGMGSLSEGTGTLNEGLNTLVENNDALKNGAAQIFSSRLDEAAESLSDFGITLTAGNYQETLTGLIGSVESAGNTELAGQLTAALTGLDSLKEFQDGVSAYVDGAAAVQEGAAALAEGSGTLNEGLGTLTGYNETLVSGADQLLSMLLTQVEEQLKESGIETNLTEANYQSVLTGLMGSQGDDKIRVKLQSALDGLNGLKTYQEGIAAYTEAVSEAADGSEELLDGIIELQERTDEVIDEYFHIDIDNLTKFVEKENNPRIEASINDVLINKYVGMAAGVIVMILFTFVISVFVVHGIEREYEVIGALYALGVKKEELSRHYVTLPVVITMLGGIAGTILGFSPLGTGYFSQESTAYFSLPDVTGYYPLYLILYGIVMPPLIAVIVNLLVINKKLSQPPLRLLRNEQAQQQTGQVKLKKMSYVRTFQIRQFLREIRSSLAVIAGMFISLLILMLGVNCQALCDNLTEQNNRDATYQYMYTFKYPQSGVPAGGEACYVESFNKEAYGYDLDVTLLGIDENNPYFNFQVEAGKNKVSISQSAAVKFNLKEGDDLIVKDEINERNYAFTVDKIVPYSIGLYVFMDITDMRELFDQEDDYYNVVLADEYLNIDAGRLHGVISRESIQKSSEIYSEMLASMIIMMTGIALIIFVIVMYLMMKVMLDRSAYHISLMKVFGYRRKEIKQLYLDGNFVMVSLSALICIPASKLVIDALYPYFISNVSMGADLSLRWYMYLIIYAGTIFCYFLINKLLVHRINKMHPAEILKNRE